MTPFYNGVAADPPSLSLIRILQGTRNRHSWVPIDTVWCLIPLLMDGCRFCSSESLHTNSWIFCGSLCALNLLKICNYPNVTKPSQADWKITSPVSGSISCPLLQHFLTSGSWAANGIALLVQGTPCAVFRALKERSTGGPRRRPIKEKAGKLPVEQTVRNYDNWGLCLPLSMCFRL